MSADPIQDDVEAVVEAAEMLAEYAEFVLTRVRGDDLELFHYQPSIADLAERLRALSPSAAKEEGAEWTAGEPPRDGQAYEVRRSTLVRWKPYKPDGARQMKRPGRWQMMNEYGGWENVPTGEGCPFLDYRPAIRKEPAHG